MVGRRRGQARGVVVRGAGAAAAACGRPAAHRARGTPRASPPSRAQSIFGAPTVVPLAARRANHHLELYRSHYTDDLYNLRLSI